MKQSVSEQAALVTVQTRGLTLAGGTQYWLVAEGLSPSTLDIWWHITPALPEV